MNGDALEAGVRLVMNGFSWHLLGLVALAVSACLPNFLDRPWRNRERRTLAECRVLTRRILDFLPVYEQEMANYAGWIVDRKSLQPLIDLAKALPDAEKIDAEKKFCIMDAPKLEAIVLLQMEMNQVLRHNKEA
jgi:hypothetical protein